MKQNKSLTSRALSITLLMLGFTFLFTSCDSMGKAAADALAGYLLATYVTPVPDGNNQVLLKAKDSLKKSDQIHLIISSQIAIKDGTTEKNYNISGIAESGFSGYRVESLSIGIVEDESNTNFKKIGVEAFSNCEYLEKVRLHAAKALTSIGSKAFFKCASLKTLELPDSPEIYTVGSQAFASSGLKTVIIRNTVPPSINSTAFENNPALTAIYVPDSSVDSYKTAEWAKGKYGTAAGEIIKNIIKPLSEKPAT